MQIKRTVDSKCLLAGLLLSFAILSVHAQPTIEWQDCYGGTGGDFARSVEQTTDGGYIICGNTSSNNGDVSINLGWVDYWVLRLNSLGELMWEKSLGGSDHEIPESIVQTSDGGFIVAGFSRSQDGHVTGNHGEYDFWVVKLCPQGGIQWEKSLGGAMDDQAFSIIQTLDGGYMVAGDSHSADGDVTQNQGGSDAWVVKLSSSGTLEWQRSYGGSGSDAFYSIRQTVDGGYIAAGLTAWPDGDVQSTNGSLDYWVVKLSGTGDLDWERALGGSGIDSANQVEVSSDGSYIVAGVSLSGDGDITDHHGNPVVDDYWVVKLKSDGEIEWKKSLGGSGYDVGRSIQQTLDGGYVVAGSSGSSNGNVSLNQGSLDYWIVHLTSEGEIDWEKSMGGSSGEGAFCIRQTADQGYIVAGHSMSNDGDVTSSQGSDFWVVKLSGLPDGVDEVTSSNELLVYPNPARDEITLVLGIGALGSEFHVYDELGRLVFSDEVSGLRTTINLLKLSAGLYQIHITGTGHSVKFVKE